jgi:peptide/nickel transport system permease protein
MLIPVLRRLISIPVVLWATTTLTFLILRLVPGDAVDVLAANLPDPHQQAAIRAEWGLTRPLWAQYAAFMGGLVHGNLGVSLTSGTPVGGLLADRFPATIELAVVAMILTTILGIGLGVLSAVARNSWLDYASRGLALLGFAVPWFWFALMLIVLFAVQLRWAPVSGRLSPQIDFHPITNFYLVDSAITGNWAVLWDALRHLALPALALGLTGAGFLARTVRATLLETLHQDYIRTAKAKGLRRDVVVLRHALRNALLPVVTLLGLQFGSLLGGALIVESIFAWPGVAKLLVDAVFARDYPVVQGGVILIAAMFVLANAASDVLSTYIDPRIRAER